jgi:hypothetical protein
LKALLLGLTGFGGVRRSSDPLESTRVSDLATGDADRST